MILPDDCGVGRGQVFEHLADFFLIVDAVLGGSGVRGVGIDVGHGRMMDRDMPQRFRLPPAGDFVNDNPSADDRQIPGERAFLAKATQNLSIVLEQFQEDLGEKVVLIVRGQRHAARMGRVPNDVHEQPREPVHKILPASRFIREAASQQFAVNFGESHGMNLSAGTSPTPDQKELRRLMSIR